MLEYSQGRMRTKQEKLEVVKEALNVESAKENWGLEFSAEQISNKIDNLVKKAKKTYEKFRRATATGSAVESKFDLEVCLAESGEKFRLPLDYIGQ